MLKQFWRFRSTLWPGLILTGVLLGFAGVLFGALYHEAGRITFWPVSDRIVSLLKFTLFQATLSTLLSLLLGLLLAWSLAHQPRFCCRSIVVALFSSSLVLPSLIVAFGIIAVLGNHGWLNQLAALLTGHTFGSYVYGLGGILIAHVYLNASFASIGLLRAFESIPVEKYRLSASLGLSPWQRFWILEWAAVRGSIPRIGITIFLLCFSSFAIVLLLGGSPAYNTLEVAIYEAVRIDFDLPAALQIASIQLMISITLLLLASGMPQGLNNLKSSSRLVPWAERRSATLLQRLVILLLSLIYLLPLIAVVLDGFHADLMHLFSQPLFLRSLGMSLWIAAVSALLTVLFSIALAEARRHFGLPLRITEHGIGRIFGLMIAFSGNLYLAVPSLIMGLGFFLIARTMGGSMTGWGIAALLSANFLMSLPFALAVMIPAMQKTARRYDKLAFSLGLTPLQRWRYAEWPYLRRSIGYIAALSFSLSLGDLGVIALFGNREITTLPWYLYQLMGSYRTTDAAGVALVLLVLVFGVFFAVQYPDKETRGSHAAG